MGSAVFNIMVIVGVTAIFAGQVLDMPPTLLSVRVTLNLTLTLTTDPNHNPRRRGSSRASTYGSSPRW